MNSTKQKSHVLGTRLLRLCAGTAILVAPIAVSAQAPFADIVSPPFPGISFPGGDLSSARVAGTQNAQTCSDRCKVQSKCVGWTMSPNPTGDVLMCHLKSQLGAPVNRGGSTSGTVVRQDPMSLHPSMAAPLQQAKFADPDMANGVTRVTTAAACSTACLNQNSCLSWTLVATNPAVGPAGACHLKSSTIMVVNDVCCTSGKKILNAPPGRGGVSSAPPTTAGGALVMSAAQPGIAFPGNDLKVADAPSDAKSCRAACDGMDACMAYTFNPTNGGCHLKSKASPSIHVAGATSGSKH